MRSTAATRLAGIALTFGLLAGCGGGGTEGSTATTSLDLGGSPEGCVVVDMSVSSEKIDLLNALAKSFNQSKATTPGGSCIFVRPQKKASGLAAQLLADNWDEKSDGPRPVIWSPAASSWGAILNQRLADQGKPAMAPADATPFMLTPLVIAMPKPMADALGYPDTPVGYSDILALARDPQGWASKGHPEWGPFRLGKTNPNFSTSGLSALIAQNYAAVGKTKDLTAEDLANPATVDFNRGIESAVVHYGDITMTFLNNWFRADRRGTALTYASAVAVEEKSVIDYNQGNPDGILDPGEEPRKPKIPLVAVYPSEGTLYSDSPFYVLDADWVSKEERAAAEKFGEFVQQPKNQAKVLEYGFRPANPDVEVGAPILTANGVDPDQPQTLLQVPEPAIMVRLLEEWARNRKTARVLIVLDVSGSMGDPAGPDTDKTRLELAKTAVIDALDQFKPEDQVGLRIFSTGLGPGADQDFVDLLPIAPIRDQKERLIRQVDSLVPTNGTPLYTVAQAAYDEMAQGYDPAVINAVLLLTDGINDDGEPGDDEAQLDGLTSALRASSSGENAKPVRMFTVGYSAEADMLVLREIAEASNAAAYNARDATSIRKVFAEVVSNF